MPILVLPSQTEGSLGVPKVDRDPRPNATESINAAEWNALCEAVVNNATAIGLDDGSTEGSVQAQLLTLGGGGGIAPIYGSVIWEWNKTDLTQFDTEATFSDGTGLTGTIAMTYNATGWRGLPTIDFTASNLDGGGIFPVLASEIDELPHHYWVYARMVHVDYSDSSLYGCVGCFGNIDTDNGREWRGIVARRSGSNANEVRVTTAAGSEQQLRTTGVNNQSPATAAWATKTEDMGGSEFQFECYRQRTADDPSEWMVANVHRDYQFIDSGGLCRSDCSSYGDTSPDWDGEEMDRVGIGLMRSAVGGGGGVVRFSEFKIIAAA